MNPLEAMEVQKNKSQELYLPHNIKLGVNLIHAFIKNNNIIGLKLAIILSGAKNKIEYDNENRVKFVVDELCQVCKITRRELSNKMKAVISTKYTFVDTNGDVVGTTPIHTYRYTRDNKFLYISVSQEARKLFTELGKGGYQFTRAISDNLMSLKHKHSLRMQLFLEMVNNYSEKVCKRTRMTLPAINGYFGVNYENFYEFERKILKPVKEEITMANKLTFEYQFEEERNRGIGRAKYEYVIIDVVDNSQNLFAFN